MGWVHSHVLSQPFILHWLFLHRETLVQRMVENKILKTANLTASNMAKHMVNGPAYIIDCWN